MRPRFSPVLLVAVVAIVAGCGGSSKKAASPSSTSPATTAASATTAAASTTTSQSTPSPSGVTGDCKKLADLGSKFGQAMAAASASGTGDPAAQAAAAGKAFQDFASQVPSEIRGDFETFGKALSGYAKAMAGMHFTPGQAPSAADMAKLGKAVQVLSTPELKNASAHLSAWAQKNCAGAGFGTATTP